MFWRWWFTVTLLNRLPGAFKQDVRWVCMCGGYMYILCLDRGDRLFIEFITKKLDILVNVDSTFVYWYWVLLCVGGGIFAIFNWEFMHDCESIKSFFRKWENLFQFHSLLISNSWVSQQEEMGRVYTYGINIFLKEQVFWADNCKLK